MLYARYKLQFSQIKQELSTTLYKTTATSISTYTCSVDCLYSLEHKNFAVNKIQIIQYCQCNIYSSTGAEEEKLSDKKKKTCKTQI